MKHYTLIQKKYYRKRSYKLISKKMTTNFKLFNNIFNEKKLKF